LFSPIASQEFETKLREFLRANPKDYYPDTTVDVLELCANMRCIMQFSVKHRDNWQVRVAPLPAAPTYTSRVVLFAKPGCSGPSQIVGLADTTCTQ
jgi:hypothetical protein